MVVFDELGREPEHFNWALFRRFIADSHTNPYSQFANLFTETDKSCKVCKNADSTILTKILMELMPKGDGNCAKMWRKKNTSPWTYVYDDIECTPITTNIGYICERPLTSLECGRNGESLETVNHMHIMLACYSTVHHIKQ